VEDRDIEGVHSLLPRILESAKAAAEYAEQHLATYTGPIYESSPDIQTSPDPILLLREYQARPAADQVSVLINFVASCPITCYLGPKWRFGMILDSVADNPTISAVGRHPARPGMELLEMLIELEKQRYAMHPKLSARSVQEFWSSFDVHKELTVHALKMARYYPPYQGSPWSTALDYARQHVTNYVSELARITAVPTATAVDRLRWAKQYGATVQEMEDIFNIDRKTINKALETGELRAKTIEKSTAFAFTWRELEKRLQESRKFNKSRRSKG
jgi:hypothetical protein